MTNKEQQLLLKDLCARLPYGVKIATRIVGNTSFSDSVLSGELLDYFIKKEWGEIKPYLRPMSSMTETEIEELKELCDMYDPYHDTDPYDDWGINILTQHVHSDVPKTVLINFGLILDWLNRKMFDYRFLIPMGLALEAPEGMYKEGGEK